MARQPTSTRKFSTRLIRKGALLEETYAVFQEWDLEESFAWNIDHMRTENIPGANNQAWLKEIITTLSSRYADDEYLESLVLLAKRVRVDVWRPCVLWHIGRSDELYYQFATEWLFNQYVEGAFRLRTHDVEPCVRDLSKNRAAHNQGLSSYGLTRAARDLLRMASDFGLLQGSAVREFVSYNLSEQSFLYLLHVMYEANVNAHAVVHSPDWRLYLMSVEDVERELFRLHQYRKLHYEVAGSVAELTLPHSSAADFVKEMAA